MVRHAKVRVNCSIFTPMPQTKLERAPMEPLDSLRAKLDVLKRGLKKAGAHASLPEVEPVYVEAALRHADQEAGKVVERVWRLGGQDGHRAERADLSRWLQAFQECGIEPAAYAQRPPGADARLPWSHLDFRASDPPGTHTPREPAVAAKL